MNTQLQSVTATAAHAPGCYGAPSVFSHDSEICQACPTFQECSLSCMENLKILRETLDVSDLMRRHLIAKKGLIAGTAEIEAKDFKLLPSIAPTKTKVERKTKVEKISVDLSEDDELSLSNLGVKPKKEAIALVKSGMVELIKSELNQGRSPYASLTEPNAKSVMCDEILKGKITKKSIKVAFMKHLGRKAAWKESSAASNAAIFVDAFEGLKIIEQSGVDSDGKKAFALKGA